MDANHQPHPRINASMLIEYHGKTVTIVGIATSQSNDGRSFQLVTSDGKQLAVSLDQPTQDSIHGLVEVHGRVDERNNIFCHNYILFGAEADKTFDMDAYNQAVEIIHKMPQHYPIQTAS